MLADIQRRRSRQGLPSRPQPLVFPQLGQLDARDVTREQGSLMAQAFVFGPMMIYSGLGRQAPRWVRTGLLVIGVGTVVYSLYRYFFETPTPLGQMNVGPFHKADPTLHRQTILTSMVAPR